MVSIEAICRNNNVIIFCESILTLTYDQTYLQLFMWDNGTGNILYDSY